MDLSVLIPSRNEEFLNNTIQSVFENSEAETEVIVVLDGQWPVEPIPDPDNDRLTVVYHPASIGQRAATNEAARLARGKYVMKLDAHCAMGPGFDRIMLDDMQPEWTMVPIMRNLHVFNWLCQECGHTHYQGPTPEACPDCQGKMEKDIVWIAKTNPQSRSYCFDPEPRFRYFREFNKRPEGKGELTETMSLQGSCWMLTKEKYFELEVCDEAFGSWGSQGIEVACKTWLSGGRVIVNHKTYYAHAFRTQGGDWSFPYPLSGKQVSRAKKMARDIFFNDKWPKQVRPLSWLVKRFWPVRGWTDEDLAKISMTPFPRRSPGDDFLSMSQIVSPLQGAITDGTPPRPSLDLGRKEMSSRAVGFSGLDISDSPLANEHMVSVKHKLEMGGVAATGIFTDVVQDRDISSSSFRKGADKPSVDQPMNKGCISAEPDISISKSVATANPNPAMLERVNGINLNLGENAVDLRSGQIEGFREILTCSHSMPPMQVSSRLETGRAVTRSVSTIIPQTKDKSILYYTDNRLDPTIMTAVQKQLVRTGLPIISVSLKPLDDFGQNIVLDAERSPLTMFRQILAGLEASTADIIYFCEHDILYHPSHFDFTPCKNDIFYYNENSWRVDAESGHALFYYAKSTSGLCAYRSLLLEHYRERVRRVEQDGHSRRMGFEPGTHGRAERIDDYKAEAWMSEVPNIDIRHGHNLTPSRWKKTEFRNQRYTKGWTESDTVPGWGKTEGRFPALLSGVLEGR